MNPLSSIFEGDVNITLPCNSSLYGNGSLYVVNNGTFYGSTNSISPTTGTLVVYGGLGINLNSVFGENISVLYGTSYLTSTIIDTTNGIVSVTGGNAVSIAVGNSSQFIVTGGTLTLTSNTQNVYINGGANSSSAIQLNATNSAGGIQLNSGNGIGGISLISGSGGISNYTSSGALILTCNNANAYLINNTYVNNQNISIELNGATDSQLLIQSSGINQSMSAILINTTNTAGNINLSNYNGLGNGSININTGTGGLNIYTNTGGNLNIITQAANANYLINSNGISGQIMTIGITSANINANNSSLILTSSGINSAININTTNTAGNININQVLYSNASINIFSGMGGFKVKTQTGGSIIMNCYGNNSYYQNFTTNNNQDLTVSVTGGTQSRVNIISDGTTTDAININSTGGIYGYSNGPISFQTTNMLQLATNNSGTPVQIGTPSSTTTIFGNLDVKGTTTNIESVVVTIDDNIITVNNAPAGTSNGGIGIKRYQYANNIYAGDVVQDTPDETGILQTGTMTSITLPFTSNTLDNYYKDWWIMIISGTGAGQVRQIKSYTGLTKVAIIYSTADQTTQVPVQGLDFLTTCDNTSGYSLFPCSMEFMIWNEFVNEFQFGCAPNASNNTLNHFANVQMNNIIANNINTNTINNSTADIITTITLTNNSTTSVAITAFPNNYGCYIVMVEDQVSNGAYAIFNIGRNSYSGNCGNVVRTISIKGANNEMLDISWSANSYPALLYRPSKNISGTTTYNVKIISI